MDFLFYFIIDIYTKDSTLSRAATSNFMSLQPIVRIHDFISSRIVSINYCAPVFYVVEKNYH